ncbi:LysR substrate-binding domain-containing protein [Cupriavidus sp. 30B13]|uniref:LysR family transcriptional regulator n=1 Tax=Cupriavidus sp. 30B13 TaxID=3384241 RepID=UPI003CEB1AAB
MRVFQRIVEANSFTRAAETLGLPPSSVTSIVQNLEAHLGVRLLQRTTRRLSLTPDGAVYFEHCNRILDDIDSVEGSFPGVAGKPKGKLRVDAPISICKAVLIPALKAFQQAYPDIELTLSLNDRTVDLVQEGVDCAIRTGALADSATLVGRQVGTFEWMTCAAPAYLAEFGEPESVEALRQHRTVGYTLSRTGRPLEWSFVVDDNLEHFLPAGSLFVNDAESYAECGVAGLGIVQAGSYLLLPYIDAGKLVPLLRGYALAPVPVSILYARNRNLSPTVRAFLEWAMALFADSPVFNGERLKGQPARPAARPARRPRK